MVTFLLDNEERSRIFEYQSVRSGAFSHRCAEKNFNSKIQLKVGSFFGFHAFIKDEQDPDFKRELRHSSSQLVTVVDVRKVYFSIKNIRSSWILERINGFHPGSIN
ncbi:unnamed protein product [Schistosoma guineensis]|nr:unnamed protein product [Schistosoma guineensis]